MLCSGSNPNHAAACPVAVYKFGQILVNKEICTWFVLSGLLKIKVYLRFGSILQLNDIRPLK